MLVCGSAAAKRLKNTAVQAPKLKRTMLKETKTGINV